MGVLRDHNLAKYISDYGITVFAETGTGHGTAVEHAMTFSSLKAIYSCDIDKEQIAKLSAGYARDSRVRLYPCGSEEYLTQLLGTGLDVEGQYIEPPITESTRVLWFLDSHYPGFDLHKAPIDGEPNLKVRLPLQTELDILLSHCRENDVIIADDLRIYQDGPFTGGNMKAHGYEWAMSKEPLRIGWWEDTHVITKDYRDSGYLIMVPKAPIPSL